MIFFHTCCWSFHMFIACVCNTAASHVWAVCRWELVHSSAVKNAVGARSAVKRCCLMKSCILASQHKSNATDLLKAPVWHLFCAGETENRNKSWGFGRKSSASVLTCKGVKKTRMWILGLGWSFQNKNADKNVSESISAFCFYIPYLKLDIFKHKPLFCW